MVPSLLRPPSHLSPGEALELSQRAPAVLKSSPSVVSSNPALAIFSATESPELWLTYENLLVSCLRTGDDKSAYQCLERLITRFGDKNERIMAFKGLLKEAEAENDAALGEVLKDYERILSADNTNIPITKRRVALLRSLGRHSEAVAALTALLDFTPTDAEAWAELADIYFSQGLYPQAVFAFEEVLILTPNAWNNHARLGEIEYMAAMATGVDETASRKYLTESLKRFCRSIELCDDYLRGYYGLTLVTSRLLKEPAKVNKNIDADDFALPAKDTVERLHERAVAKLSEIVRRSTAKEPRWRGYEESEVAAARELLSRERSDIVR